MSIRDTLISLIEDYKKAKSEETLQLLESDLLSPLQQTQDKFLEDGYQEEIPHVSRNRAPPSTLLALSK